MLAESCAIALGFGVWVGLLGLSAPMLSDPLKINEIRLGGASSFFVEVRNAGVAAVSMTGVTLETSQGSFTLGAMQPLQGGAYMVLVRSSAAQAGLLAGNRGVAVAAPIAHVMQDTLLLKRNGSILDAVSYGVAQDSSARYTAAVQAGQFANGSFVKTASSYSSISIGRNGAGADTDSHADWALHGGADSYNASPARANTEVLSRSKDIIRNTQTILNQMFVNVLEMRVAYATHSPLQDHQHWHQSFDVESSFFGNHTLAGDTTVAFVPLGRGNYDIVHEGVLGSANLSVSYTITESVRQSSTSRVLSCVLVAPDLREYKFTEDISTLYTGSWGNYTATQTRNVLGWDGVKRVTSSTQRITWPAAQAEVVSGSFELAIYRDFPTNPPKFADYSAWQDAGGIGTPPGAPYVTETIKAVADVAGSPGNVSVNFTTYNVGHDIYGQGSYNQFSITSQETQPNQWLSSLNFDFVGPVTASVDATSVAIINPLTEDLDVMGSVSRDGVAVGAFDYYIDPVRTVAQPGDGFFDWLLWGVNTAVTGAICGAATAIATGTTIVVGTVTIGTGVPAGVVGIGATAGACATATTFVGNALWPGS